MIIECHDIAEFLRGLENLDSAVPGEGLSPSPTEPPSELRAALIDIVTPVWLSQLAPLEKV